MGPALTQLGQLPIEVFLQDYWQKKPLLIRAALPGFHSPLSPDDLAGLALEEAIESRIITHTQNAPWQLQCGPFSENYFQHLPEKDWTLLVQAVDHWVPDIAELLHKFRFIPNWRIDDIMASYAPTGGSVGPHFDQYDVFLLQGAGTRLWHLGQNCDDTTARLEGTDLNILQNFETKESYTLKAGDMLYIPPGVAHWGISQDNDCITYSIGFRAPSHADILCELAQDITADLSNSLRFQDAKASPAQNPGLIDTATIEQLHKIAQSYLSHENIATWFGKTMSEPKYTQDELLNIEGESYVLAVKQNRLVSVNAASRFCYYPLPNSKNCTLFVDGSAYQCTLIFAEILCGKNAHSLTDLAAICSQEVLMQLINNGCLLLDEA